MSSRSFRRVVRRASLPVTASVAAALFTLPAAAEGATAATGWGLQIQDGISLGPGGPVPDQVSAFGIAPSPGEMDGTVPLPVIYRGEVVIAGDRNASSPASGFLSLADLRDGDLIVLYDRSPESVGRPELARYTYSRRLRLDAPICAGRSVYGGSRTAGSEITSATSMLWVKTPGPSPVAGYPDTDSAPDIDYFGTYPGGVSGWTPTNTAIGLATPVGQDRLTFDATRPTTIGMRVGLGEAFWHTDRLAVNLQVIDEVVECATPPVGEGQAPPVTTPRAEQPAKPAGRSVDRTPPTVVASGLKASTLKKLGRAKLIAKGLPFVVQLSEPGRIGGTIELVAGKRRTRLATLDRPATPGLNTLKVRWSTKARSRLRKSPEKAKLRIALTVTDAAGNTTTPPPVTVKLPR